ncbi:MAG: hypothetical protein ACOCYB_03195 [Alkalispirochaeta sp.]
MRRNAHLTLGILVFVGGTFLAVPASAQETPQDEMNQEVFAPFVSRLRVAVRDPQIRLTWRDSTDLTDGTYRVYRHSREITTDTIDDAEMVAELDPGVETYLDTPEEEGTYYYAVLAAEPDGRTYPIFVPFRNKTLRPVEVTRLATEEELSAEITGIRAQAQDASIVVVFDPSRNERTLSVYRSTEPFDALESVSDATLLDEIDSTNRRFVDYPVPGVRYYYGVFDRALVERDSVEISTGENVLSEPVQIALEAGPGVQISVPPATKRRAPLPILRNASGIHSGPRRSSPDMPRPSTARPLSSSTETAIEELLSRTPEPEAFEPEPHILPQERSDEGTGVAQTLSRVVTGEFSDGDYERTADLLETILQISMSAEQEYRIRFYLGQALYFEGERERAFMQFLMASESEELYTEARPWIDGMLSN